MNFNPILIVPGEPRSIFFEIFFKSINSQKIRSPLIIICDKRIFYKEIKRFKFRKKIEEVNQKLISKKNIKNKKIYLVDIPNNYSSTYIQRCFLYAFSLLKKGFTNKIINGPINKTKTLNKKYLGVTEYISHFFNQKKFAMLIYNKKLSVCPVTTHLPIKLVARKITKKKIKDKIIIVNEFYKKYLGFKPRIAVIGMNPHCESVLKFNEDTKIIHPVIKSLKNKVNVKGPFPADTIFLKQNRKKYDVILGMYHDQVLAPIKTLLEYNAINITLGLPFYRISPDHGPNEKMFNKNLSNPLSLIQSIKFLDKR